MLFLLSPKFQRNFLIVFLASVFILSLSFYLLKPFVLESACKSIIAKIESKYEVKIKYTNIQLLGLNQISVQNIQIQTKNRLPFFEIDNLKIKVNILSLFLRKIKVDELVINHMQLNMIKNKNECNYTFKRKSQPLDSISIGKNYLNKAHFLVDLFFGKTPKFIAINECKIRIQKDSIQSLVFIKSFQLASQQYQMLVSSNNEDHKMEYRFNGYLDANAHKFSLHGVMANPLSNFPLLNEFIGLKVKLNDFDFAFESKNQTDTSLIFDCNLKSNGLLINHWRLASEDVNLEKGAANFKINIGTRKIEFDSSSNIQFNKINFSPYFKYQTSESLSRIIDFSIDKKSLNARDFFESIPAGLFKNLEGLKIKGELDFHFKFHVDLNKVDSLIYECELKQKKFVIESLAGTNLNKMNNDFLYTAYEHDVAIESFMLGVSSPNFVNSSGISPYLINSILIAEDPEFFRHRGFSTDAFRESIIKNINEKRFARGGSTLSMQLVKNVFLNRNKNIARKIEEALIVWLIENNHITSKERMFEVYLNVIEWGPKIYGAKSAAQFYFAKSPAKLRLAEAIFLAYLIPHPKYFASSFDQNAQLKPYMNEYYKLISAKLLKKNWITPADTLNLLPNIKLTGNAKFFLKQKIANPDSLTVDEI